MNEREAYIALNMMERIGPVGVRALVKGLGAAARIFEADRGALYGVEGIHKAQAEAVLTQRSSVDWQGELVRADAQNIDIVTRVDAQYPEPLKQIHDPPLALYVKGQLQAGDKRAIAIVGTRRPTHYGRESAGRLSEQLSRAGFTILSGLAEGIDAAAHKGALGAGGRTVAVAGNGLDHVYPVSNAGLAQEIAQDGAVLSEFPFGKKPDRTTFPMRNRIVSGLSMGVLVVEAGARSGALITVNQALDQGRSVFAVPGRIDSYASRGTHRLIQEGAQLVTCAEDVLSAFEFLIDPKELIPRTEHAPAPSLTQEESQLVGILEEGERSVDSLIRESKLNPAKVGALLVTLEMKKMVRMLPGRVVERRTG